MELNADNLKESYDKHISPKEDGDIPTTIEDYNNIPLYLETFDDVVAVNKYNDKVEIHIAKKTGSGYVRIITLSSNERNSLQVTKLWGVSDEKYKNKN